MEATTTGIVVKMIEAGLGVSLVPLMPSALSARRSSGRSELQGVIEPIDSGIPIVGAKPYRRGRSVHQFLSTGELSRRRRIFSNRW